MLACGYARAHTRAVLLFPATRAARRQPPSLPSRPAPPSGVARAGWRLRALARARAQLGLTGAASAQKKAAKKQKVAKEDKKPKTPNAKTAAEDNGEPEEKRPRGAYFVYCEEKRNEVRAARACAAPCIAVRTRMRML